MTARALAVAALALACGASPAAAASCPRAEALSTGTASDLYRSVSPFEHYDAQRSQVFPFACSSRELAGAEVRVAARAAPGDYETPYVLSTRDPNELYLYGYGPDAARDGAFVAAVDADTLRERWRTTILDTTPANQWSYPGLALAHGDGDLYAVYGNRLVRLSAATGDVLAQRELPEDPRGTGAAYNGIIVLGDGTIAAKGMERGRCPASALASISATTGALSGLLCSVANQQPSALVLLERGTLRLLDHVTTPEPVAGRITADARAGRQHIYLAGRDSLFRYAVDEHRLTLDRSWGPVRYRTGSQQPGTGSGILGEWVVVQTNFLPARSALTVTAVHADDSSRVHRIRPFANAGAASWIISKPALDTASMRVYTHDTAVGSLAALELDPRDGFSLRWKLSVRALNFSALVGPPRARELIITDWKPETGDRVRWFDDEGRPRATSGVLDRLPAPGNIVTPGFAGRFYYIGASGHLWELRPQPAVTTNSSRRSDTRAAAAAPERGGRTRRATMQTSASVGR